MLGMIPRDLMRKNKSPYAERGWADEKLIAAAHGRAGENVPALL